MLLIPEKSNLQEYLKADEWVDFTNPAVRRESEKLFSSCGDEITRTRTAFEFVRDKIPHTYDIRSRNVARTASEVLLSGNGICYAKSMLLAALLRSQGIPAGFCYQKLLLTETPERKYCLHAVNAVYLSGSKQWMRIDSRGNTNGINAQFIPGREQLAFPCRSEYGELENPTIYAIPPLPIIRSLNAYTDALELYLHGLPDSL